MGTRVQKISRYTLFEHICAKKEYGIILNLVLNPTSEYYIATASWRYKENQ